MGPRVLNMLIFNVHIIFLYSEDRAEIECELILLSHAQIRYENIAYAFGCQSLREILRVLKNRELNEKTFSST